MYTNMDNQRLLLILHAIASGKGDEIMDENGIGHYELDRWQLEFVFNTRTGERASGGGPEEPHNEFTYISEIIDWILFNDEEKVELSEFQSELVTDWLNVFAKGHEFTEGE